MISLNTKDLVSSLAVISTVLQFLSGVLVCRQYLKNRTTGEASALPFISTMLSCSFWLLYGLVRHEDKIIFVNTIGVVLMSVYTSVFYCYTPKKMTVLKQLFLMTFFLLLVIGYVYNETNHELLVNRLGILCCSLTLLTIISPMSKLFHVLKVKSTECLPFPMILMSFFVSLLWYIYGVIINDAYLQMPNFLGGVLAMSQLSLFVCFPRKPQTSKPLLPWIYCTQSIYFINDLNRVQ